MMTRARFVKSRRAPTLLVCAVVTASAPGGTDAPEPAPPVHEALQEAVVLSGCVTATAGQGFVSIAIPDAVALDTLTFGAQVDTVGIDAVIALSAGVPTSFNNLATAVRFNPDGNLDARNGNAYAATGTFPYGTANLPFKLFADVASRKYTVLQGNGFMQADEIARQYAFRPTATATHVDHLSLEVDGPTGTLTVCDVSASLSSNVSYMREGTYSVVPLASNQAVISDGVTTQKLNAAGATTATLASGGQLAVDLSGNVSIARLTSGTLTIDSYTPAFVQRWHTTQTVPSSDLILAVATDSAGATRVATGSADTVTITTRSSTGVAGTTLTLAGDWVAFDGDQPVVAYGDGSTLHVTRYTPAGAVMWADGFAGNALVSAMAIDPSHNVIFGGQLFTPIDFGGGTLPTHTSENGPFNGFVVKLTSAGAHVFSHRTEDTLVGGIAANATRIAVSNTLRTQFRYQDLQVYDATGAGVSTALEPGWGENGLGGSVALSSTGRLWWNVTTIYPLFPTWSFLVAGQL